MNESNTTVVIPTLRRPHLLRRCVLKILSGTALPERIIVCDQSNDSSTRLIAEGFQSRGVNLTYIHLDAPGASAARNAGLQAARTDLIAFIDDDCVPSPQWLASLIRAYLSAKRDEEVSGVTGQVMPLISKKSGVAVSSRTSIEPRRFRAREGGLERGAWAPWDVGTGANILAPRSVLLSVGGFNTNLGPGTDARAAEDVDLLYRLARVGTLVYEPQATVYHPTMPRRERTRSRAVYGRGMGSMLAEHLYNGDPAAPMLTSLYFRHQATQAFKHGVWGPVEAGLVLGSAAAVIARQSLRLILPKKNQQENPARRLSGTPNRSGALSR